MSTDDYDACLYEGEHQRASRHTRLECPLNLTTTEGCRHCQHGIVKFDGTWVAPDATGDDKIWFDSCPDNHESREAPHQPGRFIGSSFPASTEAVQRLLAAPAGGGTFVDPDTGQETEETDTRSEWRWLRLANGDLMLGFYPQGDWGYSGSEVAVEADYAEAERNDTLQTYYTEDD